MIDDAVGEQRAQHAHRHLGEKWTKMADVLGGVDRHHSRHVLGRGGVDRW